MSFIKLLSLLFIFTSCSVFKPIEKPLSTDINAELTKACLESNGEGRIRFQNRKVRTSFDTGFDGDLWLSSFNFPFIGEELFEVNTVKKTYKAGFASRVIGSGHISKSQLKRFLSVWAKVIIDLKNVKAGQKTKLSWSIEDNALVLTQKIDESYIAKVKFSHLVDEAYFSVKNISLLASASQENLLNIELNVSKCLETSR